MENAKEIYRQFEAMVQRHRSMLRNLCRQYADTDPERRRDLMQEVLAALWQRYDRLPAGASPMDERLWLYWTARKVFSNETRRQQRRLRLAHLDYEQMALLAAEEVKHDAETLRQLAAGFDEEERQLLELFIAGHNSYEIAELLHVSPSTITRRRDRLLERLREESRRERWLRSAGSS